jgi:hypothetical protein
MTAEFQEGFATAPDFLAPTDFGIPVSAASAATTTTRVLESSPPTLTDLDRILAAIGGINARLENQNADINARFDGVTAQNADINARFDGVTARFDALGGRLQAFESLGPHLYALHEHVQMTEVRITTTDGVLNNLDKRISTTTDLITDTTKRVDEVATDKLIDYGSRLVDYGSRLGHFTNTLIPKLRSGLDAFATRVTTIEGRPSNPTTHDI